jgi:alginate O-acetyltransferase complex protein AlgI
MLFNTLQFVIFFIIVYSLYLILNHKWQNRMLLAAGYIFYGAWDWRFLFLLFNSTIIDYFCGLKIYESNAKKKKELFFVFSIVSNLLILGFFKYFNFFASSLQNLFNSFGFNIHPHFLHIFLYLSIYELCVRYLQRACQANQKFC